MSNKKIIHITEGQLRSMIMESVQSVLTEKWNDDMSKARKKRYQEDEEYRNKAKTRAKNYARNNKEKMAAKKRERYAKEKEANILSQTMEDDFTPSTDAMKGGRTTGLEGVVVPEPTLEHEDQMHIVDQLLHKYLTPRQRCIIELSFGLYGEPPTDLDKIAEILQMKRESVRAAREKALRTIQEIAMQDRRMYNFVIQYLG